MNEMIFFLSWRLIQMAGVEQFLLVAGPRLGLLGIFDDPESSLSLLIVNPVRTRRPLISIEEK
jgi:hypothetical protein